MSEKNQNKSLKENQEFNNKEYIKTGEDTCKETLERMLGIPYQEFEKLDFDEQQILLREAREKNKISEKESDTVTMMVGNGEHSMFLKRTKGTKVMIGSGENASFVESGLTYEQSVERYNTKINNLYSKENKRFKEKIKSIFRKNI